MRAAILAVLVSGCIMTTPSETGVELDVPTFSVTAPWNEGAMIPRAYGCDGNDTSPALRFSGIPENATHLALVMDDPDAPRGTWVHWLWWDAPVADVAEGSEPGVGGSNSWGRTGYGGPCPPNGTHRYYIHVYALDGPLGLPPQADMEAFRRALPALAIGQATVMGTYQR